MSVRKIHRKTFSINFCKSNFPRVFLHNLIKFPKLKILYECNFHLLYQTKLQLTRFKAKLNIYKKTLANFTIYYSLYYLQFMIDQKQTYYKTCINTFHLSPSESKIIFHCLRSIVSNSNLSSNHVRLFSLPDIFIIILLFVIFKSIFLTIFRLIHVLNE